MTVKDKSFRNAALSSLGEKQTWPYRATEKDLLLKISFWNEHRKAIARKSTFMVRDAIEGICSYTNFYRRFLKNKAAMAWLLSFDVHPAHLRVIQEKILDKIYDLLISENETQMVYQVKIIEALLKANSANAIHS